jgi:four helix bundle protein
MRRAASSISANIAEGCGRYGTKEKIQFYKIANGSLLELKSFCYLSNKLEFLSQADLDDILPKLVSSQKLTSSLIRSMRNKDEN